MTQNNHSESPGTFSATEANSLGYSPERARPSPHGSYSRDGKMRRDPAYQSGQTLVLLLVFMATAMTVTAAAVTVTIINARSTSGYSLGQNTLSLAESGIDNALLRLVRDPAYTGETLALSGGTVTISVSGSPTKTITSVAESNGFKRTVQATADYSNNTLNLTTWKEIP